MFHKMSCQYQDVEVISSDVQCKASRFTSSNSPNWMISSAKERQLRLFVGSGHGAARHVGGYQNYGPLLGPLNTRCRII